MARRVGGNNIEQLPLRGHTFGIHLDSVNRFLGRTAPIKICLGFLEMQMRVPERKWRVDERKALERIFRAQYFALLSIGGCTEIQPFAAHRNIGRVAVDLQRSVLVEAPYKKVVRIIKPAALRSKQQIFPVKPDDRRIGSLSIGILAMQRVLVFIGDFQRITEKFHF